MARGAKAFYTTPLKALSNQKRHDLARRLGAERVGLLTGDRVVNPEAPVVVMTTEVLRALLHERAPLLDGLAVVVLDEFHWLQEPSRGPVWEEVVILTPPDVALVCLSATLPEVDVVANWVNAIHGDTAVVVEHHRPVLLSHLYAVGNVQNDPPTVVPMFVDSRANPMAELLDGPRQRQTRGEGLRDRNRARATTPARRDLLAVLQRSDMLSAIWFMLSRAGCDAAVAACLDEGVRLTDPDEARELRGLAGMAMEPLSEGDQRALNRGMWAAALEAGVAAHHGGLAPVQREAVEQAFAEGLVKVVFATETLAVGVNLPARTVVIDRVARPEGHGGGLLTATEFAQLAGRAGRRGIDDIGYVVVPWGSDVSFHQVFGLAGGRPAPLVSSFHPTPAMVANLVARRSADGARDFVRSSLAQHLLDREAVALAVHLHAREEELARRSAALAGRRDVVDRVDDGGGGDGDADPASSEGRVEEPSVDALAPGDVVIDPGRPAFGRALVVGTGGQRRGESVVEIVRRDGRRAVASARDFRGMPKVVARLALPNLPPNGRGFARQAAALLDALPTDRRRHGDTAAVPAATNQKRQRLQHDEDRGEVERLAREVEGTREHLSHLRAGVDPELDATVALLQRRGHLDGWSLTQSGRMVRRLFHDAGLLIAEGVQRGVFDGLDGPELAALASCFTPRSRGSEDSGRLPTRAVVDRWQEMRDLAVDLERAAHDADLPTTPLPDRAFAMPIHRWAAGADLDDALAGTTQRAGDLIREARQVAELLEQLRQVAAHDLLAACDVALKGLLRGAVVAEAPRDRDEFAEDEPSMRGLDEADALACDSRGKTCSSGAVSREPRRGR